MKSKAKPLICFWLSYVVFHFIFMFFQTLDRKQQLNPKQISRSAVHFIFHFFGPFSCSLSVVLSLVNRDYPPNLLLLSCPNKQCSFQPFMRMDRMVNRQQFVSAVLQYASFSQTNNQNNCHSLDQHVISLSNVNVFTKNDDRTPKQ